MAFLTPPVAIVIEMVNFFIANGGAKSNRRDHEHQDEIKLLPTLTDKVRAFSVYCIREMPNCEVQVCKCIILKNHEHSP